jgi:hypothetical protein
MYYRAEYVWCVVDRRVVDCCVVGFLRHLGVTSVKDIPGYTDFSENKILEKLAESVRVPVGSENAPDTKKEKLSEENMGEAGVSQSDGGTL